MNARINAPMSARWVGGPDRHLTRFGELARYREGLYEVAPDTYAWLVPNGSWGETNMGLVNCGGHSVLIDTCWDLHFTQEMLTFCAPVTGRAPIETVINTHADGDHCWGNQLFAGREIIASEACIRQMHHVAPGPLSLLQGVSPLLRQVPVCGLGHLGRYMGEMLAPYDFYGVRVSPATAGFSGERTLTIRGVELVLHEVGPAHTDGDVYVHVPSRRVVYAGDMLFVGVTPVMWSGPVERMQSALQRLMALDVDVIVPGHGPLATRQDVQAMIDYWDFCANALARLHRAGMPPDLAAQTVLCSQAFRALPCAGWSSPERLVTSATTLYRHWGKGGHSFKSLPGKLGQLDLMRRQAQVASRLPEGLLKP